MEDEIEVGKKNFYQSEPLKIRFIETSGDGEIDCSLCGTSFQPGKVCAAFFKSDVLIGPICDMCIHHISSLSCTDIF